MTLPGNICDRRFYILMTKEKMLHKLDFGVPSIYILRLLESLLPSEEGAFSFFMILGKNCLA
jgi:hypothetical protein